MKNTFLSAIIALFIGITANAQSTVDSISAKYKLLPMPAPMTVDKTFPVLGSYQLSTGASAAVSAPVTSAPATTTPVTNATDSNAAQTDSSTPAATTAPVTTTDVATTEATP